MKHQVLNVLNDLVHEVGSPRALAVKLLANAGEWKQLQELKCRPRHYADSESYFYDSIVTDLLRKCDLPSGVDREAAAVATFYACEKQNATTNVRLSRFLPESRLLDDRTDERVCDFISHWRKDVKMILGNLPDHLTPRFSQGATYADAGSLITIPDKMSSAPTIYSATRCLLPHWNETSWSRALTGERPWQSDPTTVRGNVFFTVPKDGLKFRGCCKEASIPVTYQLDAGRIMKERLLRIGIDLRLGQDVHRSLARVASESDDIATVDMSNASDLLARLLPKLVLPGQWYELLDSLRATHTEIEGRQVRLEKFSSMGNGFTFELETLLFSTLARTVIRLEGGDPDLVRCYGDDLIVPSRYYLSVAAGLRMFGFTLNMDKTFAKGPFRESCGGDYWNGVPVRALFIKELPDEPQQWIALVNGLRRVACADGSPSSRWDRLRRTWFRALDHIPDHIRRCRGPEHLGDVVIHDRPEAWNRVKPRKDRPISTTYIQDGVLQKRIFDTGWNDTWDQTEVEAYLPIYEVLKWNHWSPATQLASCTLGLPSDGVTPRDGVIGYRVGRVPATVTSTWLPKQRHVTRESDVSPQHEREFELERLS